VSGAVPAGCVFCTILAGELPAAVVSETTDTLAFLDVRPVFPGHVLLVPRIHVETLPDLPTELLAPFFGESQRLARAVVTGLGADGSFVAMNNTVSQSVPHLHVHVIPRRRKDGLRGFFWPRQRYASDEDMAETARVLREAVSSLDR
jgi:histidine triad (HIT) family protein